jgi:hypothetical protein
MTTHPPNWNEAVLDIRKIESDIRERTLTPAPARPHRHRRMLMAGEANRLGHRNT